MLAISSLWPATARSHPQYSPASINRYLKVDLISAERVRIVYTLMIGPGPALAERRLVDEDASGELSDRERAAIGERARRAAAQSLHLWLDGQPVKVEFGEPVVGLAGRAVTSEPFSIDLEVELHPRWGRHRLTLDDELAATSAAESEVRIVDSPRIAVLAADRGEPTPGRRQLQFLFSGPKRTALEDRSVTVEWETIGKPPIVADRRLRSVLAVGGGVLLAVLLAVLGRRYRSWKG